MEENRDGPWRSARSLMSRRPGFVDEVLDRVRADGPLASSDLAERRGPKGSWWDWDDGKLALEHLFMSGRVTATRRPRDFARLYDLPERVIPVRHLRNPTPSREAAHRELIDRAGRALGVATAHDLADYFRLGTSVVKPRISELVEERRLLPVRVEGWRYPAYLHCGARVPRNVEARALLSMFDPIVWNRRRAESLFDFHYRIEIYTPEPKRRFGYYVLPFLLGDRLVGRVDVKAERTSSTLLVPGAFAEEHASPRRVVPALADELRLLAEWLELDRIVVGRRGSLAASLRSAIARRR
jgi:uncharacterized protein YcaQ